MEQVAGALQTLLGRLATQAGPRREAPGGALDAEAVWRCLGDVPLGERRRLMPIAGWLWRTGVHETAAVVWLLRAGRQAGVRNWYAYYGPRGPARRAALEEFQRHSAARERGETEQWLRSLGGSLSTARARP